MSFFDALPSLLPDPILSLPIAYAVDPRAEKVNLGIGSYHDSEGLPLLLTSVQGAETLLLAKNTNKEYAPIEGTASFLNATTSLLLGSEFSSKFQGRLFAAHSLGGTGALRLGGELLAQKGKGAIYLPHPTWLNHEQVFIRSGLEVHHYNYYDNKKHGLDFEAICNAIRQINPGSILLLQAGCHNPTGVDPSQEQWKTLSSLIKQQKILPFFDCAYLGFAGTPDEDAWPIRTFAADGHEMLIATSFSKNFGLYGERVGTLTVLTDNPSNSHVVGSQIRRLARANYSNPPKHGGEIVETIFNHPSLKQEWLQELADMRLRLQEMRHTFIANLERRSAGSIDWNFLSRQRGFFAFCSFTSSQVETLIRDYAIYMPPDGRINVAGLNHRNMDYVVNSICTVVEK